MKSIALLLGTGLLAYAIEIILVGGFLAFLIQKRKKAFSWFIAIPVLMTFFALNEIYYIPALLNVDATFTVNNQELAEFLEIGPNTSLSKYILEDFISITSWFLEAIFSYAIALLLTKPANQIINRTVNTSALN